MLWGAPLVVELLWEQMGCEQMGWLRILLLLLLASLGDCCGWPLCWVLHEFNVLVMFWKRACIPHDIVEDVYAYLSCLHTTPLL